MRESSPKRGTPPVPKSECTKTSPTIEVRIRCLRLCCANEANQDTKIKQTVIDQVRRLVDLTNKK